MESETPYTSNKIISPAGKPEKRIKADFKKNFAAWAFLLPFLILYVIFMIYPIINGFIISLTTGDFGVTSKFDGLANYIYMMKDKYFWQALLNTIFFVIISTPAVVIFGLISALIVNSRIKGRIFLRVTFFLPYILSISVMASIWKFILQPYTGLLNGILHQLGVANEIYWLGNSSLAWFSILLATLWWTVGFNMILFLAGLQEIDDSLYEAASIDGANSWRKFWSITFPSLKGVIVLVVLLQTIASFKLFGQPWLLTGGGPGTSTRPIVQYIYETAFRRWDSGYAASMSYVLFIVMAIFSFIQFKAMNKKGE